MATVRSRWSPAMEDALLAFLREEVLQGKRENNIFKAKTWEDALPVILAVLPEGYDYAELNSKKILSKWDNTKKDYHAFTDMKNCPRIGWDERAQRATCTDAVWEEYTATHAGAKKFRMRGLRNYDKLDELLSSSSPIAAPKRRPRAATPSDADNEEFPESIDPSSEPTPSPPPPPPPVSVPPPRAKPPNKRQRRGRETAPQAQSPATVPQSLRENTSGILILKDRDQQHLDALAMFKLDFPAYNSKRLFAVMDLFELPFKAGWYMTLEGKEQKEEWLNRQLVKGGFLSERDIRGGV